MRWFELAQAAVRIGACVVSAKRVDASRQCDARL
jgi:hypothetical protein